MTNQADISCFSGITDDHRTIGTLAEYKVWLGYRAPGQRRARPGYPSLQDLVAKSRTTPSPSRASKRNKPTGGVSDVHVQVYCIGCCTPAETGRMLLYWEALPQLGPETGVWTARFDNDRDDDDNQLIAVLREVDEGFRFVSNEFPEQYADEFLFTWDLPPLDDSEDTQSYKPPRSARSIGKLNRVTKALATSSGEVSGSGSVTTSNPILPTVWTQRSYSTTPKNTTKAHSEKFKNLRSENRIDSVENVQMTPSTTEPPELVLYEVPQVPSATDRVMGQLTKRQPTARRGGTKYRASRPNLAMSGYKDPKVHRPSRVILDNNDRSILGSKRAVQTVAADTSHSEPGSDDVLLTSDMSGGQNDPDNAARNCEGPSSNITTDSPWVTHKGKTPLYKLPAKRVGEPQPIITRKRKRRTRPPTTPGSSDGSSRHAPPVSPARSMTVGHEMFDKFTPDAEARLLPPEGNNDSSPPEPSSIESTPPPHLSPPYSPGIQAPILDLDRHTPSPASAQPTAPRDSQPALPPLSAHNVQQTTLILRLGQMTTAGTLEGCDTASDFYDSLGRDLGDELGGREIRKAVLTFESGESFAVPRGRMQGQEQGHGRRQQQGDVLWGLVLECIARLRPGCAHIVVVEVLTW